MVLIERLKKITQQNVVLQHPVRDSMCFFTNCRFYYHWLKPELRRQTVWMVRLLNSASAKMRNQPDLNCLKLGTHMSTNPNEAIRGRMSICMCTSERGVLICLNPYAFGFDPIRLLAVYQSEACARCVHSVDGNKKFRSRRSILCRHGHRVGTVLCGSECVILLSCVYYY